jgi:biotin carboxyl carrier protein
VQELQAEMAANVWKIVVAPGDRVAEGDVVMILESMKMEIPVESEWAGVVSAIHCGAGQSVAEGDLLAEVDDRA